jgi:outer membrane protein TolC
VKMREGTLRGWAAMLMGFALAPALALAQVSLATVVDLAQHKSSAVMLAEADVQRAQAALAQARDVYFPSLSFGSGLPAFPSVGFTGGVPSMLSGNAQFLAFSLPQKYYINAGRSVLEAASLNLKDAQEQIALDASTVYIELDTNSQELAAAHQQESFADHLVKIEQARAEAGVDPLSDLLQAQLTSAELKLKRLHLETRAGALSKQLSNLTGLPMGSIIPDHASIPEIPQLGADVGRSSIFSIESARLIARSKQQAAKGDAMVGYLPQVVFGAQYSRSTKLLNNADQYYKKDIPTNNFSSGFTIQLPLFDLGAHAKSKQSAAEALRATVEAEQAERQNEVHVAELTGSLRELDTLAEIASLKQQIAHEQLQSVLTQLELGNGAGTGPGTQPQLSPKAEQLARIDERQKYQDALDAGVDLAKARLSLLRALGHMQDWLNELHGK